MVYEYGIFNNEGLVEGKFFSRAEAKQAAERYEDDSLEVLEICPEHEGQPRFQCEMCDDTDYVAEDFFDGEDEDEWTG